MALESSARGMLQIFNTAFTWRNTGTHTHTQKVKIRYYCPPPPVQHSNAEPPQK
jgi:hypothetical protein